MSKGKANGMGRIKEPLLSQGELTPEKCRVNDAQSRPVKLERPGD